MVAYRGSLERMTLAFGGCPLPFGRCPRIQEPLGDVDPVDHQIGEHSAAEIPEPTPVTKAIFVEGLVGRGAEEVLPGHLAGIHTERHRAEIGSTRRGSRSGGSGTPHRSVPP